MESSGITYGSDQAGLGFLFALTAVTVLALPINIVSGLFGMNVGGILLASDEGGFWAIVALVAVVTVTAGGLVRRRQKDV